MDSLADIKGRTGTITMGCGLSFSGTFDYVKAFGAMSVVLRERYNNKVHYFNGRSFSNAFLTFNEDEPMVGQDQTTLDYDHVGLITPLREDDVWPANV